MIPAGAVLLPRGHWVMPTESAWHPVGEGLRFRAKTLQGTRQPPRVNYLTQNVNSAEVKNPTLFYFKDFYFFI